MKTKIIPFDLETAKKIQAGEIEGKIMCHFGTGYKPARIICWDRIPSYPIVGLVKIGSCFESVFFFDKNGETQNGEKLGFEVPDNEPQFKPFDKVLVREDDLTPWQAAFFSHIESFEDGERFAITTSGDNYNLANNEIIPYKGNEHLVGTTDKPKEE